MRAKKERLLPEEKETVIRWDKASNTCTVWTADNSLATQLKKKNGFKLVDEGSIHCEFECNKSLIKILSVRRRKKTVPKTSDREED